MDKKGKLERFKSQFSGKEIKVCGKCMAEMFFTTISVLGFGEEAEMNFLATGEISELFFGIFRKGMAMGWSILTNDDYEFDEENILHFIDPDTKRRMCQQAIFTDKNAQMG